MEPLTEVPYMKTVDSLPSHLKRSYHGDEDDWYKHVDLLELDLFQKHAYHPMQCYFAMKASLAGEAKDAGSRRFSKASVMLASSMTLR